MNTQLVIGPLLLLVGLLVSIAGWNARNAPPAPRSPQANDKRIIKKADNLYEVQTFVDWPTWVTFKDGFKTAEEAQALVDHLAAVGKEEVVTVRR